jgi:hypothetical protein
VKRKAGNETEELYEETQFAFRVEIPGVANTKSNINQTALIGMAGFMCLICMLSIILIYLKYYKKY